MQIITCQRKYFEKWFVLDRILVRDFSSFILPDYQFDQKIKTNPQNTTSINLHFAISQGLLGTYMPELSNLKTLCSTSAIDYSVIDLSSKKIQVLSALLLADVCVCWWWAKDYSNTSPFSGLGHILPWISKEFSQCFRVFICWFVLAFYCYNWLGIGVEICKNIPE